MERYDHVVVGAGSAGCVLAARLSADPARSVLLLEAGPASRRKEIAIPAAFSKLFHSELDWDYRTAPQASLHDRELYWPRGKCLGGTSTINAMMWVRGTPADYDDWALAGNDGWAYEDLLPYFKRSEDAVRTDPMHVGVGGAVRIEEQRDPNPGTHLFVAACQRAGIPRNPNANAGANDGVDYAQVSQRRGRRVSSADAYLAPARRRPNLTVKTEAHVVRLVVEAGTVQGLSYVHDGEVRTVRVSGEVVLSAGAVNSPQVLMLSGIGPADHLRSVGVEPVLDLPGVGSNLCDHLASGLVVGTSRTDSLVAAETVRQLARYLSRRKGLLTSNVGEAHAFLRSRDDLAAPDIELIFAPVPYLDHGDTQSEGHGYTVGVVLLQPASHGTIRLASSDPLAPPVIDPAYLSVAEDLDTIAWGLGRAVDVLETQPLAEVITDPIRPERIPRTDAERRETVRLHAETLYHAAGTCAMGTGDQAVVDHVLRVRGVAGLRVVDASVMPKLNRGHTHAATVAIAEKAADLILAE